MGWYYLRGPIACRRVSRPAAAGGKLRPACQTSHGLHLTCMDGYDVRVQEQSFAVFLERPCRPSALPSACEAPGTLRGMSWYLMCGQNRVVMLRFPLCGNPGQSIIMQPVSSRITYRRKSRVSVPWAPDGRRLSREGALAKRTRYDRGSAIGRKT